MFFFSQHHETGFSLCLELALLLKKGGKRDLYHVEKILFPFGKDWGRLVVLCIVLEKR